MVHANIVKILFDLVYDSRSFGGYKLKNVLCYDNWI